jgi:hypothetical protein
MAGEAPKAHAAAVAPGRPHRAAALGGDAPGYAWPRKTAPEGEDAGIGPATPQGSERDQIMATTSNSAPRRQTVRHAITFERVQAHAPTAGLAENLTRTFGLDPVDYAAILERTEEHLALAARALQDALNDKALRIHLQRVVGAFVGSAHGATQFYGTKVTQARDLTVASQNDDRDEDRGGGVGFESKAQRARLFAAEMGLQAYALMGAAEGAISAYVHITGEDWKPYERDLEPANGIGRQSADAELAAFG